MGESGSIALVPGVAVQGNPASIEWEFDKRGLPFDDSFPDPGEEVISPSYYAVELSDEMNGHIRVEQASSTRMASSLMADAHVHSNSFARCTFPHALRDRQLQ